jgi:hypothetical protein
MSASVEERVAAGVAWLDEHVPDWPDRIKLPELDLKSCLNCVLGQLFGDFDEAPYAARDHAQPLGFDRVLPPEVDRLSWTAIESAIEADYEALNAEWRRVIESRRAEAVIDHG